MRIIRWLCKRVIHLAMLILLMGHFALGQKLIIDCDPGIDDALALILALDQDEFELLGITTVFGNVSITKATQNALKLVELSGRDIPVYEGLEGPLKGQFQTPGSKYHGNDGLGNTHLSPPQRRKMQLSASDFMIEMVNQYPGELTIVALGSLTNIAQAFHSDPDFHKNLGKLIIMGGAVDVDGNISQYAEFNIHNDPLAADIVFSKNAEVHLIPLDVTGQVVLSQSLAEEISRKNNKWGSFYAKLTDFYLNNVNSPVTKFYLYDPTALLYLLEPSLFTIGSGIIDVAQSGQAKGQTKFTVLSGQDQKRAFKHREIHKVALDVNEQKLLALYRKIMLGKR